MNLEEIKSAIKTNVYHITSDKKVALHKHQKHDELFYCINGSGYGVLENSEIGMKVGEVFNVPAGTLHALRTDDNLCVGSFLIPVLENDSI
jgi:mannose-6-phosphate isomerase-like protein (cupin superfamily)